MVLDSDHAVDCGAQDASITNSPPVEMSELLSASDRLNASFAAMAALGDERDRIFSRVYASEAKELAATMDARAAAGDRLGPLAGWLVTIKDCFDVRGEPTRAGSRLLGHAPAATADAEIVERLRAADAIIIGRTQMSEFAFTGVGMNPHYGTPGNAKDPARIPGGSSSGGAVAVDLGLCDLSVGSDTGGSVRIPAALNGITGFKPSRSRLSRRGLYPLSESLDVVGLMARRMVTIESAFAALGGSVACMPATDRERLRVAVPRGKLLEGMEPEIRRAFERSLTKLDDGGCQVQNVDLDAVLTAPLELQTNGSLVAAEAAHWHQERMRDNADAFDPRVLERLKLGATMSRQQVARLHAERSRLKRAASELMDGFDLLALPTVVIGAPRQDSLVDPTAFFAANALLLRNTSVFNFLDMPAVSLPIPEERGMGAGLMLVGTPEGDEQLLEAAVRLETVASATTEI